MLTVSVCPQYLIKRTWEQLHRPCPSVLALLPRVFLGDTVQLGVFWWLV